MKSNEQNKPTKAEPPESERGPWYLSPEEAARVAAGHREMVRYEGTQRRAERMTLRSRLVGLE